MSNDKKEQQINVLYDILHKTLDMLGSKYPNARKYCAELEEAWNRIEDREDAFDDKEDD